MNNFNFPDIPTAGISTNFEQEQPQPEDAGNQLALFTGIAANVHPSGQDLTPAIPTFPPAYQQGPEPRQLSTLNVSPLAAHYLPLLGLSQTDFPPLNPFAALATQQPLHFDEHSQLVDPYNDRELLMDDIDDIMKDRLKEDYVSAVPRELNRPSSRRADIISIAEGMIDASIKDSYNQTLLRIETSTGQDTIDSSVDKHFNRFLPGTSESAQQSPSSKRKSTTTKTTTTHKKRATNATSMVPLADRAPNSADKWIIVAETEEKRFKCGFPECSKSYKRKFHLKAHFIEHTGVSKFGCTYPECIGKEYFRDRPMLTRHIQANHTFEKPFKCDTCKRQFRRKDQLNRHKKKIHFT